MVRWVGKNNIPCPRSHLRIWSRATGLAVPSRVSPFIVHTQAEHDTYTYSQDSFRFPRRRPYIYTPIRRWASPEFARSLQHARFIPIVGVGKRGDINGSWRSAEAALVRNYLEVYWSCAGELSAVNAIGTQVRDPMNSGLTR